MGKGERNFLAVWMATLLAGQVQHSLVALPLTSRGSTHSSAHPAEQGAASGERRAASGINLIGLNTRHLATDQILVPPRLQQPF